MAPDLAKKHGFTIYDSIEKALTRGGPKLAVDGVLLIGEHGNYPKTERGQILYPRRRFFEETAKVFEKSKTSVPVFNDKPLAATWADQKWMYDKARTVRALHGWLVECQSRGNRPWIAVGMRVGIGHAGRYSRPFEGYGFHALEALQCMVERAKAAESG